MEKYNEQQIPVISILLVTVNVLIWFAMELAGDTTDAYYMVTHGAAYAPFIVDDGEWWRMFSCLFLHFGAEHLMNNMLMLLVMGMRLENVLGKISYLLLYMGSGVAGSALSLIVELNFLEPAVSAGASGAVFGIVGGLVAMAVWNGGKVEGLTTRGLVFMLAISLLYGIIEGGVDNWGHVGGLLGGFVIGSIFAIIRKFEKY